MRADARELIREWKEFSEKQQKRENFIDPEVKALRERILEHKNEEVQWYKKKSDSGGTGTIVDCDEEKSYVLQDREVISGQNPFSDEALLKLLLPALNGKKK